MQLYYYSLTGQTRRLAKKLELPINEITDDNPYIDVSDAFVLIIPTYAESDNGRKYSQSILDAVFDFIEHNDNASKCVGIVGSGNLNFADLFCWSAHEISQQHNIPVLAEVEFRGTRADIETIKMKIKELGAL